MATKLRALDALLHASTPEQAAALVDVLVRDHCVDWHDDTLVLCDQAEALPPERQRQRPRTDPHPHLTRQQREKEAPMQAPLALFPAAPVALSPDLPAATPGRRPKGEARNKAAALIDTLRAAGVELAMTAPDFRALKETSLSPEQVAEVFLAIHTGGWGDDWQRRRLTVRYAIDSWNGYQASTQPRAPSRNGTASANGTVKHGPAMAAFLWARAGDALDAQS